MGLFYAYLNDDQGGHYLLTFINREAADEWWRMISTAPSIYAGKIIRNSPQFYTHNDARNSEIVRFYYLSGVPDAPRFNRKMFITNLQNSKSGRIPITILPITITDHISGRWYFIQSRADPFSHWYVRIKGACLVCGDAQCDAVHVSSEYRTKFCIRASNPSDDLQEPEELVMIGRDEISIAARKGYTLHINDAEDLKVTKGCQAAASLLLGDLKNRFITQAEKQVNGEIWEYAVPVERGSGEAWELVD